MPSRKYITVPLIIGSITMLASGIGAFYSLQSKAIYNPDSPVGSRKHVAKPSEFGINYIQVTLVTEDNVKIRAFVCKRLGEEEASNRPTILMFHGNGGNMGHRLSIAERFYKDFKCNVVLLSYRGYGRSEGSPSEKGICLDAQKILDYIKEDEILKNTKLIIYGQSLGGSVAIDLISRNGEKKIDALILENTYLSIPKLLPEIFPTFKCLSFLCTETWRSDEKILTIQKNFPMLFLSGNKDQIVPSYHMKELFELARTTTNNVPSITSANANNDDNKIFKEFENGDHNDTFSQPGYFEVIKEFLHNKCFVIIDKQYW
ncbi:9004_t:CDS:2 [Entrophospora sp. SA101]|nr:9004_t:CDS:2 [Entrophospora sp. SA101]